MVPWMTSSWYTRCLSSQAKMETRFSLWDKKKTIMRLCLSGFFFPIMYIFIGSFKMQLTSLSNIPQCPETYFKEKNQFEFRLDNLLYQNITFNMNDKYSKGQYNKKLTSHSSIPFTNYPQHTLKLNIPL